MSSRPHGPVTGRLSAVSRVGTGAAGQHLPALPDPSSVADADLLDALRKISTTTLGRRFYLAGGTGLALQVGHRRSNDLDYFIDSERIDGGLVSRNMERSFGRTLASPTLIEATQTDWAVGPNRRKVSFVAYPFPPSRPLVVVEGQPCADVVEIAAMKAYALGRRGTARDYVDIETVLRLGLTTIAEVIGVASTRFVIGGETVFSERLFLQQLLYSDDLPDRDDIAGMDAVTDSLARLVRSHVERDLPG